MSKRDTHYDRYVSVDDNLFDAALEITLRGEDLSTERVVRIPVEDIPGFLSQVTTHSMAALRIAAKRLEVGHCETCGNTELVEKEVKGRTSLVACPDCGKRRASVVPFRSAPHVGWKG